MSSSSGGGPVAPAPRASGVSAGSGKVSEAVGRLEAELAQLWATPDERTGEAKVRASMLNLAVVTAASELERLRETADDLTQSHPGRVFLLTVDPRLEPWEVRTEVSAVCRQDGGTLLCSDRVELAFGTMVASRAASVVASLALPEVPTIVESAVGASAPLVDALAARSDRVVVDSAHTPWSRIAEIANVELEGSRRGSVPARRARASIPIGDRNFVRAYSWRDLVARFFDDAPRVARSIRSVHVTRTGGGRAEPAALLLGWLGGRLGWSFETAERAMDVSARPVAISRGVADRDDLGPGEIVGVRIEAELDGAPLSLACERADSPRVVRWSMSGARTARHEHPLGHRDETWVLIKAIDATEVDRVYRETVRAAAALCARIGC